MSLIRKIAKLVGGELRAQYTKNIVVVGPVHHFVRGLAFEATPYPRRFYLWKIIVPLFRPMRSVDLIYSDRINLNAIGAGPIYVPENAECKTVKQIVTEISTHHLEDASSAFSTQDFLMRFPLGSLSELPTATFDNAIAQFLVGNAEVCRSLLNRLATSVEKNVRSSVMRDLAKRTIFELDSGTTKLMGIIKTYEEENLSRHFPKIKQGE